MGGLADDADEDQVFDLSRDDLELAQLDEDRSATAGSHDASYGRGHSQRPSSSIGAGAVRSSRQPSSSEFTAL